MKKAIIGVTPLVDIQRNSLWMLPEYMDALTKAGAIPVMLPLTSDKETIYQLSIKIDTTYKI